MEPVPLFPSAPLAPPLTQSSAWYGAPASALGMTFGAQNIARAEGGATQRFTIIPLPAQQINELTIQDRADAIAATYAGLLMQAVDLYRLTVLRNGFMAGILATMAHGFLGLPLSWQGDPEMVAALMDVRDHGGNVLTPGDFARMHPENECAKIFEDGIGIGIGIGQYLLMCWRCDSIEWFRDTVEDPPQDAPPEETQARARRVSTLELMARLGDRKLPEVRHARLVVKEREEALRARAVGGAREVETCKRCGAVRTERPITANPDGTFTVTRELYQLTWRDPRWLWRNTWTRQWYYTGLQGMIPITFGDGEWFGFHTVPDQDMWIHGPWTLGTEAAIFTRDSRYDMQAISATCAPTHVFEFSDDGTDPRVRADTQEQAKNIRFLNQIFLPGKVKHEIHAAQGGDGGYVGTADRITNWSERQWEVYVTGIAQGTENVQGFANNGVLQRVSRERRAFYAGAWIRQVCSQGLVWWARGNYGSRPCPVGHYDTRSPEDKLAASKADTEEGNALKAMHAGLEVHGYELDPVYLVEREQAKGVRIRQTTRAPQRLTWDATVQAGFVTIAQAIADAGLPPLPPGDPRADMMVSASLKAGGDKTPAGATPDGSPAPPAPSGQLPAAPDARVEHEDLDDADDPDEDARRAARAAAMNEHGAVACRHNRTGACPRCGVRGDWMPRSKADGGGWAVTWAPLRRMRARADQERDAQGRFGSGAGEAAHKAHEASKAAYEHKVPPVGAAPATGPIVSTPEKTAAAAKEAKAAVKAAKTSQALHEKAAAANRVAAEQHLRDGDTQHAILASAQAARHDDAAKVAKYEAKQHDHNAKFLDKQVKADKATAQAAHDVKDAQKALDDAKAHPPA